MTKLIIREAKPSDVAKILELIRGLAEYEKALDEVVATPADIARALFCDHPTTHGLICEEDGVAIGFAIYFYNYSTWTGKNGLFLEDLYIRPEHRGTGAGKALLKHLAEHAVKVGCARFEWNVLDWNEPAIKFYQSFGAEPQNEWVGYRLSGQALQDFATSSE
ncbi:MAG: GNAT superfamily N-acetyltransferase [Alcanivorax sp.]